MRLFFIGILVLIFDGYVPAMHTGFVMAVQLLMLTGYLLLFAASRGVYIYSSRFLKIRYCALFFFVIRFMIWLIYLIWPNLSVSVWETALFYVNAAVNLYLFFRLFQACVDMAERLRFPEEFPVLRVMRIVWVFLLLSEAGIIVSRFLPAAETWFFYGGIAVKAIYALCAGRVIWQLHTRWQERARIR